MKLGIGIWIFGSLAIGCLWVIRPISAQIVPDATLPVNSIVTPQGNTVTITGGTSAGANLFHSFREFSLPAGRAAHFNNSPEIQNIITRVTGGAISNIDGTIKANGTANLFLLNPSGILFGQDASLNIGGSFLASSASSIKFADGNEFSATHPAAPPLLTVSVPVGLQLGQNPGEIVVRGAGHNMTLDLETYATIRESRPAGLQVRAGQTLSLVGGDISLVGGNITAEEGRIDLLSAGAGSYVSLTPNSAGWVLDSSGVRNFQDIQLSQAASADATGSGGGAIQVTARRVTLREGSAIIGLTEGGNAGGSLSVRAAESVEVIGTRSDGLFPSGFLASVQPNATGTAGDLRIETGRLTVRDGAWVATGTAGAGDGGKLTVRARESVELIGTSADGQFVSGLFAGVTSKATGSGGDLMVETARLTLRDGGQVAVATFGAGDAGSLTVRAAESVEVIATEPSGQFPSSLLADVKPEATGNGGNVTVETGRLTLRDGAQIAAGTFGAGDGGTLTVRARESVEAIGISANGQFSSGLHTSAERGSTGSAGNLTLETGRLTLRDGATVTASSAGTGRAGNLEVKVRSALLENSGSLTAFSEKGQGGNLTLRAQNIQLRRQSLISATGSQTNPTFDGNINISAQTLVLLEGSRIITDATDPRGGSNISITNSAVLKSPDSVINARGELNLQGDVTVQLADIAPLEVTDMVGLIVPRCQAYQGSSFTVTGRGGIPPSPSEPLAGGTPLIDLGSTPLPSQLPPPQTLPKSPNPGSPPPLVEAQGWVISSSGTVTLTANPPAGTPHRTWQPPSACLQSR